MSLTKVSYSMISSAPVSIVDFGAVGDGSNDDTAAIQAAVDYVCANKISALFFPFGKGQRYKLTSTVTVSRGNVSFIGDAGLASNIYDSGFIFSNVSGLTFFDFGNNSTSVIGAFGQYHMAFCGTGGPLITSASSVTNTQTAIRYSDESNGPSRPVPVKNSSFVGFLKAINLDNNLVTNTITPSWLDVQDCVFTNGTYAVYGNPSIPTLGLRFVNNISEQGGKLKGNFSSHCEIVSCLIEGQNNFLEISGTGGTHLTMRDNYLEANNGDFICDVSISNALNTVWELDYFYTFRGTRTDDFIINSGALVCKGNVESNQVTLKGSIFANSINIKNYKVRATSTDVPTSVLKANQFVGVATSATSRTVNMGGAVTVQAPHGQVTTAITNTTGYTAYTDVVTTYSAGDLITITYLVRALDTSVPTNWGGFFIQVLNQASSSVVAANVDTFFNYNLAKEWMLVTMSMKADNAGTTLKIRCQPYFNGITGAGMQIAGVSANVVTTPASRVLVAPMYPII
jgi:hypothetical protein